MHSARLYMTSVTRICIHKPTYCQPSFSSIALPEKLEHFANKYAEHSHEKWSAEKVRAKDKSFHLGKWVLNCAVFDLEQVVSVVRKGGDT